MGPEELVIPSIAFFTTRSEFVHSVFNYSLFEIPKRSALDFIFVVAEIS